MFLKQRTEDVDFSEAAPCGCPCPSPAENDDFVNELLSLWFCSHSCGGWKSKIKVLAGLISFEASLLGSQMAIFFWCPHKTFSLTKNISGISSSSQKELYWTRILLLGTCSTLITTSTGPFSKCYHILGAKGRGCVRASSYEWRRAEI